MSLNKITPEYLDRYVNFYYENSAWHYTRDQEVSMPKLQVEGAAKAWNLLLDHRIALLSDEVGMGKTIQALAVMATLLRQKPNAKILLYAPNENVARKWIREYQNFIRYHYRFSDDIVKSSISQEPLRNAYYCENHMALMKISNQSWASFLVCKTSSLSGLLSKKIDECNINEAKIEITRNLAQEADEDGQKKWMVKFSKACNKHIYKNNSIDEQPPFDLLIFDEAHYLRRTEGISNKSIVAHSFFAGRDITKEDAWNTFKPLAKNVLLLTATPNHSSSQDICNIVSLFNPAFRTMKPPQILKSICIRRFRRLNGKTKHEYRNEIPKPVQLTALREKLFFASYQKSLVSARAKTADKTRHNNPYRILFGYLEGFEFLPKQKEAPKAGNLIHNDNDSGGDFRERDDIEIIAELSRKYRQAYKEYPRHPKYDEIISYLTRFANEQASALEKSLVFVRRIPSVFEISSRLIHDYDKWFLEILKDCLPRKFRKKSNLKSLRSLFWKLAQKDKDDIDAIMLDDVKTDGGDENIDEEIPYSFVLDLFTVKKDSKKYKATDCSNFRIRFLRKEQFYSLFFEPASDYHSAAYTLQNIYEKDNKRLYKKAAQFERINQIDDKSLTLQIEAEYEIAEAPAVPSNLNANNFETLLGIWYNSVYNSIIETIVKKARLEYQSWSLNEKEGFSSYLERGVLFSSPYMVHFYSYYNKIQREGKKRGEELYNEFCQYIKSSIGSNGLAELIAKAILTFRTFYKKELGLTPEQLINEKWTFLNNTIPVYPYCGDTKRQSIIHAFNTPFFPNALIATSVLQEGVDLHYHCAEVIHYGIAWTQGDNEQRVGRVDRMFGKLENALKENSNTNLPIHYPYLENTIDEDQMCRFILRKYESEKLIDQFKNIENSSEINYLERIEESKWKSCFRTPVANEKIDEPFGINYETDFGNVSIPSNGLKSQNPLIGFVVPILAVLSKHFKNQFISYFDGIKVENGARLCAVKHVRSNGRHQPIIFELEYIEQGLNYIKRPTYCLRIKTPITRWNEKYDDLRRFGSLKDDYYSNPMLKICIDEKARARDLFRQYICVEMPLFLIGNSEINISNQELLFNTNVLIEFADNLEYKFHGDDIKNETVINDGKRLETGKIYLTDDRSPLNLTVGWKTTNDAKFIFREQEMDKEDILQTYKFNHNNNFVRQIVVSANCYSQIGVYKADALQKEIDLMNTIFSNAIN